MITVLKHRLFKHTYKTIFRFRKLNKENVSEYYFGYGANLNPDRFIKLNLNFKDCGVAYLQDHQIDFSLPTEYKFKSYAGVHVKKGAIVPGYLVQMDKLSLKYLDVLEWCGFGAYERVKRKVKLEGKELDAWIYVVKNPDFNRYPSKIYLENMIKAANQNNFSSEYIDLLINQEYKENFAIDPLFSLRTYSSSRVDNKILIPIYKIHDKVREVLCSLI